MVSAALTISSCAKASLLDFTGQYELALETIEKASDSWAIAWQIRVFWCSPPYYPFSCITYFCSTTFLLQLVFFFQAISHTPTLTEFYQLKARILKHMGDLQGSVSAMCGARELDLADRFLNTKTVKHLLAVDDIERVNQAGWKRMNDGEC